MIRSNKRQKEQQRMQKRLAKEAKQEEKKKQRASGIIAGATDEHGHLLHPELDPSPIDPSELGAQPPEAENNSPAAKSEDSAKQAGLA